MKKAAKKPAKKIAAKKVATKKPAKKIAKKTKAFYEVVFEYRGGGSNYELDRLLEMTLHKKACGAGYDFSTTTRDISWDYASSAGAEAASVALKSFWSKNRRKYEGLSAKIRTLRVE